MGARAQPRVAIEWSAPSDCGSEGPLVAEIERLLGRSLDETTSALRARITITPNAGRWGMRLVIETPGSTPGERTLEGVTCGEVTDAAAIVIALAIDPSAAERITAPPAPPTPPHPPAPPTPASPGTPSRPPSRPAATPPPVPAPSRRMVRPRAPRRFVRVRARARPEPSPSSVSSSRTAASPRPRRSRPASIAVAVHASTGIALGTVPTVGALVAAGASLTVDWARLDAAFVATLPSETTLDSGSGGGRFHLYAASIDACVRWAFGVWHPRACVGGELGSLGGSSFGVSNPGDGSSLWLAARARGVLAFAVPGARWFRPWIGLSAIVPWDRPRFVIDGRGPVYRPDALSGRAMLGVELEFR